MNLTRGADFWRRWLFRLPALTGAGLLAFSTFQIAWNASIAESWPKLTFHMKYPPGYVPDAGAAPTWRNLLYGVFQKDAARRIGVQSMLYRSAIHWKQQAYWSLLGMSGTDNIIVGRGGELLSHEYVADYCQFDPGGMQATALPWAERIRELQDFFRARGQMFLYLVTPSKVATHPEYLPAGFPCPGRAYDGQKMEIWRHALRQAGVAFVDGPEIVRRALPQYPFDLFPRGGTHWNQLGAALATRASIAALNAQGARLPQLEFDFTISHDPQGVDRDLLTLLNLMYADASYPVPVLTYRSQAEGPCHGPRIVEVAGSFIFQINNALQHLACPPDIRVYWYWKYRAIHIGDWEHRDAVPDERREDIMGWADIVLLEENEQMLPGSEHARALMAMVKDDLQASR